HRLQDKDVDRDYQACHCGDRDMDCRPWLLVLLVGLGCTGAVPPAGAQTDIDQKRARSHGTIAPSEFGPEQVREFVMDRLRDTHDLAELQKNLPALEKLAKEIIKNPDRFPLGQREKDLLQQLKKAQAGRGGANGPDLNDPEWQRLLNGVLDNQQRKQ